MTIVEFKSIPEMWEKERDGRKPNTLRKPDWGNSKDLRWYHLHMARTTPDLIGNVEAIRIINTKTGEWFDRMITDITEWEGFFLISWKHEKD